MPFEIRVVKKEEKEVINQVVRIHIETFENFFLTFMGKGFLTQMYKSYCCHQHSTLLVAQNEQKEVVGFLSYSTNLSDLYKFMINKKLISFVWYSLGAFVRKPRIFMRLVRALLKPGESVRHEKYVKLTSIGVSPRVKSKGIGSQLIDTMKSLVDFSEFEYISLETDAENNDTVNKFYVKNDFILVKTYETKENRKMNEYRYEG